MATAAKIVTEASTMGWRPGHWPETAYVDGVRARRVRVFSLQGDVSHAEYVSDAGVEIIVLND